MTYYPLGLVVQESGLVIFHKFAGLSACFLLGIGISLPVHVQSIARIRPLIFSKCAGVPQLSHKLWL
jgi:hypothetical protein